MFPDQLNGCVLYFLPVDVQDVEFLRGELNPMCPSRRSFLQSSAAFALTLAASRLADAQSRSITLAAAGDCMITRRISVLGSPPFLELVKLLRSADITFANFEMTLAEANASPAYHEGCAYVHLRADNPDNQFIVDELKWAGIKMAGLANNHSMDYGVPGLLSTLHKFDKGGLVHAGTGNDLAEARAPAYYDIAQGRVALVACASTFPDWTQAADGNGEVAGRAGLNPLQVRVTYRVTPEQLESLRAVASTIGSSPGRAGSQQLRFLNRTFVAGEPTGADATADPADSAAITAAVRRASRNADLVLMGIHAHEAGGKPEIPSPFLRPLAHACVDAGADAFLGHGPHVLRGIEIYKARPIFYSLGNFIFHGESEKQIPPEIYKACEVSGSDPSDVFDKVLPGFSAAAFWESVVPFATFQEKKLTALKLYPVTLRPELSRPRRGSPELAQGEAAKQIIATIARLSEPYGTQIRFDGRVGIVQL
jgi:poly-gamma-glutamate synthesis protein (capsule biosynthesis protein)